MKINQLTSYVKRRLVLTGSKCRICGNKFSTSEEIEINKERYGREIRYEFYCKECYNFINSYQLVN